MTAREVVVGHKLGLHARVSARLVQLSQQFEARILISRTDQQNGKEADARSILSILLLAAARGTRVRVSAEGNDEDEAVDAVCHYLEGEPVQ
jgi:phosphotransferase system HPr (HPr) family protein